AHKVGDPPKQASSISILQWVSNPGEIVKGHRPSSICANLRLFLFFNGNSFSFSVFGLYYYNINCNGLGLYDRLAFLDLYSKT
ncbi:hypothetical protein S245_022001, partial [Arachis hypogaea]